jgi:small subunit ribosomal protein S29
MIHTYPQAALRLLPEGCPALKAEFEHSGSRRLLLRPAFLRLRDRVLGEQPAACAGPRPPLVLEGRSGAGKSVMVAMLVAAARSAGWLALYVPRGRSLCEGSSFSRYGESDKWDTPDHARELLGNLAAAHGELLASLPRRAPGAPAGSKLKDLLRVLDEANPTATAVTDAGLAMLAELPLITEVPVLFAVDELNALSGWSEYHAVTGPRSRLRLEAGALRITAHLRRMDAPLARGVRLGATSASAGVSPRVHLADLPADPERTLRRSAPRYCDHETHLMLQHYNAYGMTPGLYGTDEDTVGEAALSLHALCVGSGTILRNNAAMAD